MSNIKSLIRKAKCGDQVAFSQLIDSQQELLYHTATLSVKNRE